MWEITWQLSRSPDVLERDAVVSSFHNHFLWLLDQITIFLMTSNTLNLFSEVLQIHRRNKYQHWIVLEAAVEKLVPSLCQHLEADLTLTQSLPYIIPPLDPISTPLHQLWFPADFLERPLWLHPSGKKIPKSLTRPATSSLQNKATYSQVPG